MDANVYSQIRDSIKRALKIDLSNYKDEQMKRRLDSWLVRVHASTWNDYLDLISTNPTERERFRNYLTIHVTEFFRDQNRWSTLAQEILPYLLKKSSENGLSNGLKLWSAGCSIGAEAYTLAIIMSETAPTAKYTLLATDLDRGALLRAKSGGPYTESDIRNLDPGQRQKYFTAGVPYYVKESLQKNMRFEEQDLLAASFDTGFDLIVCRNVVIYFTAEAKDMLYAKFCGALRPGGILFLGGTEIISGPAKYGFHNAGVSFYRKI
jgi:chemotaxis protein methyltransferase CheR